MTMPITPSRTSRLLVGRPRAVPASAAPIRRCCLVVTDAAPRDGAVPAWLVDGRTPDTWRFHVVVTPPPVAAWSAALVASDSLSGWVLAAELDPTEPAELARERSERLSSWLQALHDRGFRVLGSATGEGTWRAAVDLLEDRRFDEVVLLTDHRGAAGSVRRFADRLLARRLGRRFAVASLVLPA